MLYMYVCTACLELRKKYQTNFGLSLNILRAVCCAYVCACMCVCCVLHAPWCVLCPCRLLFVSVRQDSAYELPSMQAQEVYGYLYCHSMKELVVLYYIVLIIDHTPR